MSNPYRYAYPAVRHFQVPTAVNKWLKDMSGPELKLLYLIQAEAERLSKSSVPLPTRMICERTGMDQTSIPRTRRALTDYGFIQVDGRAGSYLYTLCDPETKYPVPDRHTVMNYDFRGVKPEVLTLYFKGIVDDARQPKGDHRLVARCPLPNHKDDTPSFFFDPTRGGAWHCRGCGGSGSLVELQMATMGLDTGTAADIDTACHQLKKRLRRAEAALRPRKSSTRSEDIIYPYTNEFGDILFETVRVEGKKSKTRQRQPNPESEGIYIWNRDGVRDVLYRLPEVVDAWTVIVVEGEPDADRLSSFHLKDDDGNAIAVTTKANGAGGWAPEHSRSLIDKRVILMGDTNPRGINHMIEVKASLEAEGIQDIATVDLPALYRDVSHYLESHCIEELLTFVGSAWLEEPNNAYLSV